MYPKFNLEQYFSASQTRMIFNWMKVILGDSIKHIHKVLVTKNSNEQQLLTKYF